MEFSSIFFESGLLIFSPPMYLPSSDPLKIYLGCITEPAVMWTITKKNQKWWTSLALTSKFGSSRWCPNSTKVKWYFLHQASSAKWKSISLTSTLPRVTMSKVWIAKISIILVKNSFRKGKWHWKVKSGK